MIGSNNSSREKLCGKVGFPLERQRLFLHSQSGENLHFSTTVFYRKLLNFCPQEFFPLSTTPVEKNFMRTIPNGR